MSVERRTVFLPGVQPHPNPRLPSCRSTFWRMIGLSKYGAMSSYQYSYPDNNDVATTCKWAESPRTLD